MIAGCGVLKADPKKTAAISVWPRPSRMEDLERFLATTVYIRQHLSPRYSEVSKPLRDALAQLHEERKHGIKRGKGKFRPLGPPAPDDKWANFWNEDCEEAFKALKKMVVGAVDF